jgi:hypothetical protein
VLAVKTLPILLTLLIAMFSGPSSGQVSLLRSSTGEIDIARGEPVRFLLRAQEPGLLSLEVLTADGDLVRRIEQSVPSPGDYELSWDGRDAAGQPVPDEAYCPRVSLHRGSRLVAADNPCERTGGEVISGIQPQVAVSGDVSYTLEHPARVLIRVGIKSGAMLRSLSIWRPRPAGRNLQRWNGFDDSGLVDLRGDRLGYLVTAFRLPRFAVITTGNPDRDYRAWRLAWGWKERPDLRPGDAAAPLERGGQRISRHHYSARYKDREPRLDISLIGPDGNRLPADVPVPANVRIVVDLHPDDKWLMQEQLYEVGFFVNGEFVAEEENGYVPIGWFWNTAGLPPGRHLLTVNVTGFTGRVGTRTMVMQR